MNPETLREAASAVREASQLVLLFGSAARGDQTASSDVDVLQVTPCRQLPYKEGRVSVSCYTMPNLLTLARRGSLFVLHLTREAVFISGDPKLFQDIRDAFVAPSNYLSIREEVSRASRLLDIDEASYSANARGYNATLCYLVRTYAYAVLHDRGALTFSLKEVSLRMDDIRLEDVWALRDSHEQVFPAFQRGVSLLEEYTGRSVRNEDGSTEALIVNAWGECDLVVHLGLRLLNRSAVLVPYEALGPVEAPP